MIIEPMRDKQGNVLTNVKMIKMFYNELYKMQNGIGCKTEKEKEKMEDRFYRICGGSDKADNLMAYMKQIVDEPDEDKAQKLFARSLIPVELRK